MKAKGNKDAIFKIQKNSINKADSELRTFTPVRKGEEPPGNP